jgi:tRNA G10  N-methylase Trm11
MQYFFISGRLSDLSYAELDVAAKTHLKSEYTITKYKDMYFILNTESNFVDLMFTKLGGFLAYGELIEDLDSFLEKYASEDRVVFGINAYEKVNNKWSDREIKDLAKKIKKYFRENKQSVRYVLPKKGNQLNSAQTIQNELTAPGNFELNILEQGDRYLYGKTLGVQNIDAFSTREFERPGMDKEMGVLPLKLSRIMLNLTGQDTGAVIWDPFCGSGTNVLEGLVLGYSMLGSDISEDALKVTKENVDWLSTKFNLGITSFNLFQMDITKPHPKVVNDLRKTEIKGLVTEPYMGPPQRRPLNPDYAQKLLEGVEELYRAMFEVVTEVSRKGFTAVIVIPSYKTSKGWATISLNELITNRWTIENSKWGRDLHWARPNSIIKRNIFILSRR